MKPHTHSNIARNIANGLVIARLQEAGAFSARI